MLQSDLKELATMQNILIEKGGPGEDSALFEDVLSKQKNILEKLGLPQTLCNEKMLWFNDLPSEKQIEDRIGHLKEEATHYLLTRAKTDRALLQEAKELSLSPFDVLPELGLDTHTYTIFIYNYILLREEDSIENILQEFSIVREGDLLHWVGMLAEAFQSQQEAVYDPLAARPTDRTISITIDGEVTFVSSCELTELLEQKGLRYINPFLLSLSNLLNDGDIYG
jgi:hypothetical protein